MNDHNTDPHADAGFIAATQELWDGIDTSPAALRNMAHDLANESETTTADEAAKLLHAVADEKEASNPLELQRSGVIGELFSENEKLRAERDRLKALNAELVAAGVAQDSLIKQAAAILQGYLIPDGYGAYGAVSLLLALLDGPQQRKVADMHFAALAKAEAQS